MMPVSASSAVARARALHQSGQAQEAEHVLRGTLAEMPDAVDCIDELALFIHPVAALDLYRRYFDRQAGSSYPVGNYPALVRKVGEFAVTFYRIGRKDLAGPIVDIILAYRRHMGEPAVLIDLGQAARQVSDTDRAIAVFAAAEDYPALRFEALRNLAFLHQNGGSVAEAERCLVELLPLIPDSVKYSYFFPLAQIYITQKKYERALEIIGQIERSPIDPEQTAEILCYRFLCQLELGDLPAALDTARAHAAVKASIPVSAQDAAADTRVAALFGGIFAGGAIKHVVSLGGNCDVTTAARARGIKAQSLFDWLITPHDALIDIIAEGGRRVMTSVAVDTIKLLRTAVCKEHGILYVHEFPRSEDGQPIVEDSLLAEAKRKLSHKMDVFESYCRGDDAILFIRKSLPVGAWLSDRTLRSEDLNKIVSTIEARFPQAKFHLAFVYHSGQCDKFDFSGPLDPRIVVVDEAAGVDIPAMLDYYNICSGRMVKVRANRVDHLPELFAGVGVGGLDLAELMDEMKEPIERDLNNVIIHFLERWLELRPPGDPSAHLAFHTLALAHRQRGDEAAADEAVRACLRLKPDFEAVG